MSDYCFSEEKGDGRREEQRKKKIVSALIEFVISLAVPDRWIMNTV